MELFGEYIEIIVLTNYTYEKREWIGVFDEVIETYINNLKSFIRKL